MAHGQAFGDKSKATIVLQLELNSLGNLQHGDRKVGWREWGDSGGRSGLGGCSVAGGALRGFRGCDTHRATLQASLVDLKVFA